MRPVNLVNDGPLAVIELARPETGNALEAALVEDLGRALAELRSTECRAAILTGAGRHFCTGAHLGELEHLAEAPLAERLADARRLAAVYAELLRAPFATLAAVRGCAYGGGLGLAAACDVVVAPPDARLQFSEVRLGFVPALISVFLTRRVQASRLAQLFLDPTPLDGATALAVGLVDEVAVDPLARARERALRIAGSASPAAVASTKRLLLNNQFPSLDAALEDAARVNAEQRAHPECRRGVAHFLAAKAFPNWLDGD
ncbi:MAG: enoyl-CoA hydratase/isomerase family protein [Acidobacteriota bacterium]